jgi:hypothetical protein
MLVTDIGRAAQREGDHASAHGLRRKAIDQNECAGRAIVGISIKRNRIVGREIAESDLVHGEVAARFIVTGRKNHLVLQRRHIRRDGLRADAKIVAAARQ